MDLTNGRNIASSAPARVPGAWWKYACGALMCYVIYGAFFIADGAAGFGKGGDNARAVFFHVPSAVLSSLCYFIGVVYAGMYLFSSRYNNLETDAKSSIAMELGLLFCTLATITGSIFAGIQWGVFWNWDPRETSIVIMLLLYASYVVLRLALAGRPEVRARLSAVYALVAVVPAQFLIWAVPRLLAGMHPTDTLQTSSGLSLHYKLVLYPAFLAFLLVFVWLFQLRLRAIKLVSRREAVS
ncbi:MAG TPA: cytochrome c biogenesis protein CcsA [Chthonomonadaceae bacterium]|nr:cytochrome c biogenesis protein CcsA [Chthonomonadaceae bacterium]